MRHLSDEVKWSIVHHMKDGKSINTTSKVVHCSPKAVRRWWYCYKSTGGVTCKKSTGRPPLLSDEAAAMAMDMLAGVECKGAAQVAVKLHTKKVTKTLVHKATVIRAARRAAGMTGTPLVVKRGKPRKGLTKFTKARRLMFAKANKSRSWGNVMFTDRKKFNFNYPGSCVKPIRWVLGGLEREVFQPTHPQCLNIYSGITPYGMTAIHAVAGSSKHNLQYLNKKGQLARNITSAEYTDVLNNTLLPCGQTLFTTQGISTWYLQQDNDPSHGVCKKVVQDWNHRKGSSVQLLPRWPPNSPDLNIIENVWAWVQARVNEKGCKTFEEFKAAVKNQIAAVPRTMIAKLYKSLSSRMALVIDNEGGLTGC